MNIVTLAQHGTSGMLVPIPDEHVGRLIGKQGVTIKNIQDRCRVRCILPQQADPGSFPPTRTITVQGDPNSQAMAKYEIESIIYNQQIQLGQTPTVYPQAPAGMAPAAAPYGGGMGMYGAAAGGMYSGYPQQQQQQQQYAQQYAAAAAAQAQVQTQDAPAKDHNDPTAYYTEFWQYATYYGEAAARAYYKAWSPPEGTPPPAGVVLPASASATTTPTAAAAAHVSSGDSSADGASSSSSTATTAPPSSSVTDAPAPAAVADGAAPTDDLAAKEAWEKYEREMAEWKRLYGDQAASAPVASDVSAGAASTSAPAPTDVSGDNADASAAPLDASSA